METVRVLIYLGVCLFARTITASDLTYRAENVRWISVDFKTLLTWTSKEPHHLYSVRYRMDDGDWEEHQHCSSVAGTNCDLTNEFINVKRTYTADVLSEPENPDSDYGFEDFRHTESGPFNPYKESNLSAVVFSLHAVKNNRVLLNITDTLTSLHKDQKQLTIRDIFKNDLKYKIRYYKLGNTGQKENLSDSSIAEVSKLDAGERYCFIVAAFIQSRPKATQQGEWSSQLCVLTMGERSLQELSLGVWISIIVILLTVLIIVITVTVLCCRRNKQQRNKTLQTPQSVSTPV